MAEKSNTFIVFDISTTKVVGLIATSLDEQGAIKVLSHHSAGHKAVIKGEIKYVDNLVTAIINVKDKLEDDANIKIKQAHIITNSSSMQFIPVRGTTAVANKNYIVNSEDVNRAKDMSTQFKLDPDYMVVSTNIKEYILDGQSGIVNPIGMKGSKLELIGYHIVLKHQTVKDFDAIFNRLGIDIIGISSSIISLSNLVIDSANNKSSQAIINIGSDTTGIAIIYEGVLSYARIIPIGSVNIDKDLAHGLGIDLDQAKDIKERYGVARKPLTSDKSSITISNTDGSSSKVMRQLVDNIIYCRVLEMANILKLQLKKYIDISDLTGGIILSGRGASLKAMPELLRRVLNTNIQGNIGNSKILDDFNWSENTELSPSLGYALKYYFDSYHSKRLAIRYTSGNVLNRATALLKKLF